MPAVAPTDCTPNTPAVPRSWHRWAAIGIDNEIIQLTASEEAALEHCIADLRQKDHNDAFPTDIMETLGYRVIQVRILPETATPGPQP